MIGHRPTSFILQVIISRIICAMAGSDGRIELGHGDLGGERIGGMSDLSSHRFARRIAVSLGRSIGRRLHGRRPDRAWIGDVGLRCKRRMLQAAANRTVAVGAPMGPDAIRLIRRSEGGGAAVTVSGPICFR